MARSTQNLPQRESSKKIGALVGLGPFLRPYRHLMILAGCALMLTAGLSLIFPLAVRRVVDHFNTGQVEMLDKYFAMAVVIALALAVGTGLRYYFVTRLGERVVADIRMAVFARVLGQSPAFFERILTGEIASRLTTDTTLVLSVISSSVSVALRNILLLVGGMVFLAVTSVKLTLLVLLIVPVVIVPIILLGRRLRGLSRDNQDWIALSSGSAAEALQGVQTVQAYTSEPQTRDHFARVTMQAYHSAKTRIETRAMLTVIVIFLVFSGIVGVLWVGARDVRLGMMSAGELVQFVIYAVMVAGSVGALAEIWGELQRAAGATERIAELLHTEDTVKDPIHPLALPQPVRGEICFENVHFSYPSRPDSAALQGVDLCIKAGETVALVGPSGAGKTTILQMLLRFYDPQQGRILLDGVDLRDLARHDLRSSLALVAQDPVIFAMSARDNIALGRPDCENWEIEEAAHAGAAHEFIAALPQGYDSFLGERGIMLSGGQRQRVALARAILRNAPVLLLDEATSALDSESEAAVQQAVAGMAQGRTVVVVAHRLATVKRANRIIVFDQGQIVAQGTHDSLMAQNGLYARLARLQFMDGAQEE